MPCCSGSSRELRNEGHCRWSEVDDATAEVNEVYDQLMLC